MKIPTVKLELTRDQAMALQAALFFAINHLQWDHAQGLAAAREVHVKMFDLIMRLPQ